MLNKSLLVFRVYDERPIVTDSLNLKTEANCEILVKRDFGQD